MAYRDQNYLSKPVARVQGFFFYHGKAKYDAWIAWIVVFNSTQHKGSFTIMGENPFIEPTRDLPIVGGIGDFLMTRGYATLTTDHFDGRVRGVIDLGINRKMSVAEAWRTRRRRRHRTDSFNSIEEMLHSKWQTRTEQRDRVLWRGKNDTFKSHFSTKDTWNHIRTTSNTVAWHKGVWFTHATPKYSFCVWLAAHDRLATGARMLKWNRGASGVCNLCNSCIETRDHLFFSCSFSSEIWDSLARGLLKQHYTTDWTQLLTLISDTHTDRVDSFLMRYIFQVTVYTIWRERNGRRHDEVTNPAAKHIQWIDKQVDSKTGELELSFHGSF
ncbi:Dirigent protein [Arabidopsis thaliana x Arabidopsis arenosa]|uniref:Dirigent protein n=1 Tax=Arabidopsis thaliana x Arabidopsis arenosa TaxID=1240361 RepID=A0A8T1Z235_9BRAS|nr:Dirigent protein [Arabidopsis thaliana x Arabidopsis arenosa]